MDHGILVNGSACKIFVKILGGKRSRFPLIYSRPYQGYNLFICDPIIFATKNPSIPTIFDEYILKNTERVYSRDIHYFRMGKLCNLISRSTNLNIVVLIEIATEIRKNINSFSTHNVANGVSSIHH